MVISLGGTFFGNAKFLSLEYETLRVGGQNYTNVTIVELNGDRVSFKHSRGVGNMRATQFSEEVRRKMGFDAEAVERESIQRTTTPATRSEGAGSNTTWSENLKRLENGKDVGMMGNPTMEQIIAYAVTAIICSIIISFLLYHLSAHYFERTSWIIWVPGLQLFQLFFLSGISIAWLILPRIIYGVLAATANMLRNEGVTSISIDAVYALMLLIYEGFLWFFVYRKLCEEMNRSPFLALLPALPLYLIVLAFFRAETISFSIAEALFQFVPLILWLILMMVGKSPEEDSPVRQKLGV